MNTLEQTPSGSTPPNYLVWSIVSLVITVLTCCFCYTIPSMVTAIVALVFSTKVNSSATAGDFVGAQQASRNAKLWNWVTLGLFLAGVTLWIIIFFASGGIEAQREQMETLRKVLEQGR
jgi:uncharacterized membrane-anchored protein